LDTSRAMMEQLIARNLLYYIGEQYLEYLPSSGQFRRRLESPFMPTPVSNEIREYGPIQMRKRIFRPPMQVRLFW